MVPTEPLLPINVWHLRYVPHTLESLNKELGGSQSVCWWDKDRELEI